MLNIFGKILDAGHWYGPRSLPADVAVTCYLPCELGIQSFSVLVLNLRQCMSFSLDSAAGARSVLSQAAIGADSAFPQASKQAPQTAAMH